MIRLNFEGQLRAKLFLPDLLEGMPACDIDIERLPLWIDVFFERKPYPPERIQEPLALPPPLTIARLTLEDLRNLGDRIADMGRMVDDLKASVLQQISQAEMGILEWEDLIRVWKMSSARWDRKHPGLPSHKYMA